MRDSHLLVYGESKQGELQYIVNTIQSPAKGMGQGGGGGGG